MCDDKHDLYTITLSRAPLPLEHDILYGWPIVITPRQCDEDFIFLVLIDLLSSV